MCSLMRGNWKPWIDSPGTLVPKGTPGRLLFWFLGLADSLRSLLPWWGSGSPPGANLGHVLLQLGPVWCAFVLSLLASLLLLLLHLFVFFYRSWFCSAPLGARRKMWCPRWCHTWNWPPFFYTQSLPLPRPSDLFLNTPSSPSHTFSCFSLSWWCSPVRPCPLEDLLSPGSLILGMTKTVPMLDS